MSNMSNSDEAILLLLSNKKNDKTLIKVKKQQQQQQEITKQQQQQPPPPPPLPPIFNRIFNKSIKMNANDLQLVKSRQKLTTTTLVDDDYLSIYNQNPKIIKYTSVQGTNSNSSITSGMTTTTSLSSALNTQKRINITKLVSPKDEVIHNNAKNSYYLSDSILYNIDNNTPHEKLIEKLIISKQGTVRGNLNHVKLSLKQFFKENHGCCYGNSVSNVCSDKCPQQYHNYLTVSLLCSFIP